MTPASRPLLLTVLGGGGFTFETACLFQPLAAEMSFAYFGYKWSGTPGRDGLPAGELHAIPEAASIGQSSRLRTLKVFVVTFVKALRILRRRPKPVVVTVGCSASIALLAAARVSGCKSIFIESVTRGDKLSNTGRVVYALRLADRFVVQWPALGVLYPRATVGSIL
jgi:UDP-N-acetylglucosamine:LPS N-acetylglucosamine transferase